MHLYAFSLYESTNLQNIGGKYEKILDRATDMWNVVLEEAV